MQSAKGNNGRKVRSPSGGAASGSATDLVVSRVVEAIGAAGAALNPDTLQELIRALVEKELGKLPTIDYGHQTPLHVTRALRDERMKKIRDSGRKPRAVAVIRVSQVNGRAGDSYQSVTQIQRPAIQALAQLLDAELRDEDIFIQEDEKGGEVERLRVVWEGIASGRWDILLVYNASRFARRARHALNALHNIRERGGDMAAVQMGCDIHTTEGNFLFTLLSAVAEMEYDRFYASWDIARRNAVARGAYPGRVPFGYRRSEWVADEGRYRGALIPDEPGICSHTGQPFRGSAPWLRRMYKWRRASWSWAKIAKTLNQAGFQTDESGELVTPYEVVEPGALGERCVPWNGDRVSEVVANPIYQGKGVFAGQAVEKVKALVSEGLWCAANAATAAVYDTQTGRRADGEPKSTYLLRGRIHCQTCGYGMSGTLIQRQQRDGSRHKVAKYKCVQPLCPARAGALVEHLDIYILAGARRWAEEQLNGGFSPVKVSDEAEYEELCQQGEDANEALERARRNFDAWSKRFGEDEAWHRIDVALAEVARIEDAKTQLSAKAQDIDPLRIRDHWEDMSMEEQQRVMAHIFPGILVGHGRDLESGKLIKLTERVWPLNAQELRLLRDQGHLANRGRGHTVGEVPIPVRRRADTDAR